MITAALLSPTLGALALTEGVVRPIVVHPTVALRVEVFAWRAQMKGAQESEPLGSLTR